MINDNIPKPVTTIDNPAIIAELMTFPNLPYISQILRARNQKQIWQLPSGESFMLIEPYSDDPFVFVAGILDLGDVSSIIEFCNFDFPMVYCNPIYHHFFLNKNWDFHLRVQLSYPKSNIYLKNIFNERRMRPIDNIELFKQCSGFDYISKQYEAIEDFFDSDRGYVLCLDNKVVSEAYINFDYEHAGAEINVATNPDYRGQGAGTEIASYMVEKCKFLNLAPIWSCQVDNRASLKTAIKAGFQIERYYIQMVPEVGNTLSIKLEKWINENSPINWNQ